jgi:type III secretion protein U
VTTVSLLAVIVYVWTTWDSTFVKLVGLFDQMAMLVHGDLRVNILTGLDIAYKDGVSLMLPILGVTILAGVAANYFQFGSLFAIEAIMPKGEKISPVSGFKRIFSMKQIVETLKSILKIVFLSTLLYFIIHDAIGNYIGSLACGMPCLINVTSAMLFKILNYSGFAFIVVALADFAYQRHTHTKSLMMTKEEVKREYKESEGDPHIKGKRKQLAHELATSNSGTAARKGSAVVVNPTHFAIVIDYRPDVTPLPIVTAKGRNLQAYYLRTQAEEAGVPVFRNVRLAHALYADVEVDEYIPDELFDAVAEVLTWVAKNKDALYRGRLDHGVIDMDNNDHRVSAAAEARA